MTNEQTAPSIPKISMRKFKKLVKRIRPVIGFSPRSGPYGYGRRTRIDPTYKGRLYWASVNAENYGTPLHLMNIWWDPRATTPARGLQRLGSVQVFVKNSEFGSWFQPTLLEILAQIPQRLRGRSVVAFKLTPCCDLNCILEDTHEAGNPSGYHRATIVLYTRGQPLRVRRG